MSVFFLNLFKLFIWLGESLILLGYRNSNRKIYVKRRNVGEVVNIFIICFYREWMSFLKFSKVFSCIISIRIMVRAKEER